MIQKTPYTPGMREIFKLSRAEAGRLGCDYVGPEHYLLGILRKGDGLAIQALLNLEVDLVDLKDELERLVERGDAKPTGLFAPNADALRALEAARAISAARNHHWVGSEHLLLALIQQEETPAGDCLARFGVTYEKALKEITDFIEGPPVPDDWTRQYQNDHTKQQAMENNLTPRTRPAVGVVLAGQEEFEALRPAIELFKDFDCPCEIFLSSVWAAPERLLSWAERAASRGVQVILAAAGAEPQLPGFLAAACRLPVLALPLPALARGDAARQLELTLHTSPAAPVAAVAPGAPHEAALLVLRMLALADPDLGRAIDQYRQTLVRAIDAQQQALLEEGGEEGAGEEVEPAARVRPAAVRSAPAKSAPARAAGVKPATPKTPRPQSPAPRERPAHEPPPQAAGDAEEYEGEDEPVQIRPAELDRPLQGQPVTPQSSAVPSAMPARLLGRLRVDPDTPDYQIIEEAIDCLLEGGVIAFPTETVYGLAADATNPAAVARLFELKGRPRNKAITLMVDSPKLLSRIACNLTIEARRLMEAFWPGPLTIVFQKRGANFSHVSDSETIGVRLPDHSVPLAIMQALARPLACTSANVAGQPECFTADEVERAFAGQLNLILDGGHLPDNPPSTVIDVTREPYRILRLGALSREQIAAVVGDKLEEPEC